MARSSWASDPQYIQDCVDRVCEKLGADEKEKKFIMDVAKHSNTDTSFLSKMKTLCGLKKTEKQDTPLAQETKPVIDFKEVGDGAENASLSPVFEKRLDELRKNG